jgi:hypothetical protein
MITYYYVVTTTGRYNFRTFTEAFRFFQTREGGLYAARENLCAILLSAHLTSQFCYVD